MLKNKLFIFIGGTGAGKNTVLKGVLKKNRKIKLFPSYTTRPKRKEEKEGREHFYVSKKEFNNLVKEKKMLEFQEVHPGLFYGVPSVQSIKAMLFKNSLIRDVDILGAKAIKKALPENAVLIFIKAPSLQESRDRIIRRGGLTKKEIEERVSRIPFELKQAKFADYQVINDDLGQCIKEVSEIIEKESSN